MRFKQINGYRLVIFDEQAKQHWALCSDKKYRPCAKPISRWIMITE